MTFIRMTAVVCFTATTLAAALAQQPAAPDDARIAAARALVEAMGGEGHAQATVAGLKDALIKHMQSTEPAKVVGFVAYMDRELAPTGPRVAAYMADVQRIAVDFYAQRFTAAELEQIAAFQKSEAGRKFQALTPEVGQAIAQRSMQFQADLLRAIEQGAGAPQR
ncbi:MAG: DUF2059 domain-containing protein [Hyphomicrobiaceae bacterium]